MRELRGMSQKPTRIVVCNIMHDHVDIAPPPTYTTSRMNITQGLLPDMYALRPECPCTPMQKRQKCDDFELWPDNQLGLQSPERMFQHYSPYSAEAGPLI